jgi:hypothetical protein
MPIKIELKNTPPTRRKEKMAKKDKKNKKFPDLSGDGKVTQKDILMGKGVIKKKRGGSVTGRSIGPAGASIVSDDGKRIKTTPKLGAPGLISRAVGKLAGRLAKRGYGKAKK